MDRLACFDTFVRVAERGGFAAAARDLCLSPATVTQQIQSLENRLGAPLFNRTTRSCSLTEAGRVFYERCVRILMDIKEAETLATSLHATARGTIRLNSSPTLTSSLTTLIVEFVTRHPGVSFELIATDEIGGLVEHGFDLAIRAGALPDSNLITRRLGSASWIACAAPDYLVRFGYPTTPGELAHHNCLAYAPLISDGKWRFAASDREYEVNVSGNLSSNDLQVLRAAALSGQGLAVLPEIAIISDLTHGRLVQVLPGYLVKQADVHAVFPSRHRMPAKVRIFLDFAAEHFAPKRRMELLSNVADGRDRAAA